MKNLEINGHISEKVTVSDSDSEIENDLDIEQNIEILDILEMHQENTNNPLPTPNVSNGKHTLSNNVTNITVQNSSNTRFGNETNFNAPVTINHAEVNQIYQRKKKGEYPIRKIIYFLISAIVIFLVLLTLILILSHKNGGRNDEEDDESIINEDQRYVSREEWEARPPKDITKLELPATRLIIAHTVTGNCLVQSECAANVRMIQKHHMDNLNNTDIGYNFLVGGDGAVYVGRGWDNQGAHTRGYNQKSICIAFIGKFADVAPSKQQLIAAHTIIAECVKQKKLTEDYKLYGQRQLNGGESPGDVLYKIIIKWKHWSTP